MFPPFLSFLLLARGWFVSNACLRIRRGRVGHEEAGLGGRSVQRDLLLLSRDATLSVGKNRNDATVAPLLTCFSAVNGIPLSSFDHIFRGLLETGRSYHKQELPASDSTTYEQQQPRTPLFLLGHLDLVLDLMKQSGVEQSITKNVPAFIQAHDAVFVRLFRQFPSDGDVLFSLSRCIRQFLRCRNKQHMSSGVHQATLSVLEKHAKEMVRVSLHVAENPFPHANKPYIHTYIGRAPFRLVLPSGFITLRREQEEGQRVSRNRNVLFQPSRTDSTTAPRKAGRIGCLVMGIGYVGTSPALAS